MSSASRTPTPSSPPVLSYKKRLARDPDSVLIRVESASPPTVPGTPPLGSSRKVLSRRKALQEFYKLHGESANVSESDDTADHTDAGDTGDAGHADSGHDIEPTKMDKLNTPEALQEFVKSASIREVLRVRNKASHRLNHHDLEKKAIIYDNYHELIKLNKVLSNVNAEKTKGELDAVTDKYVDKTLAELQEFLATEAAVFNQDFGKVVETITSGMSGSSSRASLAGLSGT